MAAMSEISGESRVEKDSYYTPAWMGPVMRCHCFPETVAEVAATNIPDNQSSRCATVTA